MGDVSFSDEHYNRLGALGKQKARPVSTAVRSLVNAVVSYGGIMDSYDSKILVPVSIMAHLEGREFTLYAVGNWSGPESMEHFIIAREALTARSAFEARSYALEFEALLKDVPREYEAPLEKNADNFLPSMEGIITSHRVTTYKELSRLRTVGDVQVCGHVKEKEMNACDLPEDEPRHS